MKIEDYKSSDGGYSHYGWRIVDGDKVVWTDMRLNYYADHHKSRRKVAEAKLVELEEIEEELAYERKLRRMMEGTPEYWARLTDEHTAKTINSGGLPIYDVAGEIGS